MKCHLQQFLLKRRKRPWKMCLHCLIIVPFTIGIQTTGINGIHVRDIWPKNDGICNTRTPIMGP